MTDRPPPIQPTPAASSTAPPGRQVPYAAAPQPGPLGFGAYAVVSILIGLVFLMFGWPFVEWLATRVGNPYGTIWQTGDLAGLPVDYFDLDGGTAWRDLGAFLTAIVLVVEGLFYAAATLRPALTRPLLTCVLIVGVVGCIGNALAIVMQMKAGFNQPLIALLGLAVSVITAMSALQRLRDPA